MDLAIGLRLTDLLLCLRGEKLEVSSSIYTL